MMDQDLNIHSPMEIESIDEKVTRTENKENKDDKEVAGIPKVSESNQQNVTSLENKENKDDEEIAKSPNASDSNKKNVTSLEDKEKEDAKEVAGSPKLSESTNTVNFPPQSQSFDFNSSLLESEDQLMSKDTDQSDHQKVKFKLEDDKIMGSDTLLDEENILMDNNADLGVEKALEDDDLSTLSDGAHDKGMFEMDNTVDLESRKEKNTSSSFDDCDLCLLILTAESLPQLLHLDWDQLRVSCTQRCFDIADSRLYFCSKIISFLNLWDSFSDKCFPIFIQNLKNTLQEETTSEIAVSLLASLKGSDNNEMALLVVRKLLEFKDNNWSSHYLSKILNSYKDGDNLVISTRRCIKRNLKRLIFQSSNILSLMNVFAILFSFYECGVDFTDLFNDEYFKDIWSLLESSNVEGEDENEYILNITRQFISRHKCSIVPLQLARKIFKCDLGTLEEEFDPHIYFISPSNYGLMLKDDRTIFFEEMADGQVAGKTLENSFWKIEFDDQSFVQFRTLLANEERKTDCGMDVDIHTDDISADMNEESDNDAGMNKGDAVCGPKVDTMPAPTSENELPPGVVQSQQDVAFEIEQDSVARFFKPGKEMKIDVTYAGKNLKTYYNSPCVTMIKQKYVRRVGGRNWAENFANATGECKICKASHKWFMINNPFNDKQEVTSSLQVRAVIDGYFHTDENGVVDISRPYHENAVGKGMYFDV